MRKILLLPILMILVFAGIAQAQEATSPEEDKAYEAYYSKDYNKCAEQALAAINKGKNDFTLCYTAACCLALNNKVDESFKYLEKAIDGGYRDIENLKTDTDLEALHADKRWPTMVSKCQAGLDKYLATIKNLPLRKELLDMVKVDQEIRNQQIQHQDDKSIMEKMEQIDKANTAKMKEIINKYGWPGDSLVGKEGAGAAWLLVQHADSDHDFQNLCLKLMKEAAEKGEASKQQLALLTDRVLLGQGKKQVYGTQFQVENGELKPFPIEDEANVDARRKEVGLPSLEVYKQQLKQAYQIK